MQRDTFSETRSEILRLQGKRSYAWRVRFVGWGFAVSIMAGMSFGYWFGEDVRLAWALTATLLTAMHYPRKER